MKQAILQGKDRNFSGTTPLRGVFLLKKIKEDGIMSKNVGWIFFQSVIVFLAKDQILTFGSFSKKQRGTDRAADAEVAGVFEYV